MADWHALCQGLRDLRVDTHSVEVTREGDRKHRITVEDRGDNYVLSGVAASKTTVDSLSEPDLKLWQRNRALQLVGFRVNPKGQIIGETFVPKAGLHRAEFLMCLRRLATECDQLEYQLTGNDLH